MAGVKRKFSVCVLLFGDYPHLARRCLTQLGVALGEGAEHIQDIRLGLNLVSPGTRSFVDDWCQEMWDKHGFRILLYVPGLQVAKYPLMRRMFYDEREPLADLVMWFDDDTYFSETHPVWWEDIQAKMSGYHMIGQYTWYMPMQGQQWEWIKTQDWYNPDVGMPPKLRGRFAFKFCQGAWWVIRRTVLHDLNWPIPELRHNGGDSMLGEALRHGGYQVGNYDKFLRINADENGKHSGAKRRGFREPVIGKHYRGEPLSTDHQHFELQRLVIGCSTYDVPLVEAIELPCWW